MASARVTWSSEWEEFRKQLRTLPDNCAAEAGPIVLGSGQAAHSEIAAGYAVRSTGLHPGPHRKSPWYAPGGLVSGLRLTKSSAGRFGASVSLRNSAKHAWLYDHGSQARHYITESGKRHDTGRMWGRTAPTHIFVRSVMKHKRYMVEFLKNMVRRHGLTVVGE